MDCLSSCLGHTGKCLSQLQSGPLGDISVPTASRPALVFGSSITYTSVYWLGIWMPFLQCRNLSWMSNYELLWWAKQSLLRKFQEKYYKIIEDRPTTCLQAFCSPDLWDCYNDIKLVQTTSLNLFLGIDRHEQGSKARGGTYALGIEMLSLCRLSGGHQRTAFICIFCGHDKDTQPALRKKRSTEDMN